MLLINSHGIGSDKVADAVLAQLSVGNQVIVHDTHETFYGFGEAERLRKQLDWTGATFDTLEHDPIVGFESTILVSPKHCKRITAEEATQMMLEGKVEIGKL